MSSVKVIGSLFGVAILSLVLGVVICGVTFDWWYSYLFGGPQASAVLGLIVLLVAFLVPFFCALVVQIAIIIFYQTRKN